MSSGAEAFRTVGECTWMAQIWGKGEIDNSLTKALPSIHCTVACLDPLITTVSPWYLICISSLSKSHKKGPQSGQPLDPNNHLTTSQRNHHNISLECNIIDHPWKIMTHRWTNESAAIGNRNMQRYCASKCASSLFAVTKSRKLWVLPESISICRGCYIYVPTIFIVW